MHGSKSTDALSTTSPIREKCTPCSTAARGRAEPGVEEIMSVQFGKWKFDGGPLDAESLEKVGHTLAPYGPDGGEAYSVAGVDILYRSFHTTKESRHEKQPHVSRAGAVITWDGRLDNREELIGQLGSRLSID